MVPMIGPGTEPTPVSRTVPADRLRSQPGQLHRPLTELLWVGSGHPGLLSGRPSRLSLGVQKSGVGSPTMRTAPHRGFQWRCAGAAAATRRECGDAQVRDDSSSASRRAKQNDATAQPCPARPSRACLASRTNRVPVVTRIGGRGDGAAVDDGPGCRRRADAAALSSRARDLGGRGPMRRVLRQADGGRAQTSLSWLADTLLSQDRAAPIRFCRPTGAPCLGIV